MNLFEVLFSALYGCLLNLSPVNKQSQFMETISWLIPFKYPPFELCHAEVAYFEYIGVMVYRKMA